MIDKVRIIYLKSKKKNCCFITDKQLDYYKLNYKTDNISLVLGTKNYELKKALRDDFNDDLNTLALSEDLKDNFFIPEGTVLQIRKIGDNKLELGPFIGVFINEEKINLLKSGKGITAYSQFHSACKSLLGLCCLFSINDIDWKNKFIKGMIKINSKWCTGTFPLPKVIYDRNVENNCRVESIELREKLADECYIINSMPKLAKWETILALKKDPNLLDLIPKTTQYEGCEDIENSLKANQCLYLKPNALSKGKGIFRIMKSSDNKYKVEYRTKEENHFMILENMNEIDSIIEEYTTKGGGYLIQAEIQKACYNGNPFDFRLLYQKDWQGIWQPSGIVARIGAPGSIITSPRSGGTVEEFPLVLKEVFDENISAENGLYENITRFGRKICLAIESEFGNCVELGLDMAIDVNRKIWVIEVNGKPLKVSLKRLNDSELISRCNKRPIEYAVYLSGFKSADCQAGGLLNNNY